MKNGDTDTNAAIVGGLLGAQGINVIPKEWVEEVMSYDSTSKEQGRERPSFLCPNHHLIPLTKAISLNLPTELKVINEYQEMNDEGIDILLELTNY